MQSYAEVWPHMQVAVALCALALTKDRDLQQDLVQERWLALGQVDPSPG